MTPGEEFTLLVGIEEMREIAPELVPSFEAMYDFLKFMKPPDWILDERERRNLQAGDSP